MERKEERARLTIAAIREGPNGQTQYLFHERARLFTLTSATRSPLGRIPSPAPESVGGDLVEVTLDLDRGTILQMAPPSAQARAARRVDSPLLAKPERVARLDLDTIDPILFDYVEISQKWPVFTLCTKVVPGYAKAKEIFDTCAALSCHLPSPPAIPPCIPFQYVVDGCYARAQQMRRIISKQWGYCVEKVFSFANQNNDTLAVRADKWGGCCVSWWYHVAPLLRVRFQLTLANQAPIPLTALMVIDPGMFDRPVLLSTWLAAQENGLCNTNAKVSCYSIQSGNAYTPANYAGTAYSTDPNYIDTEATLSNYSNLITCP